MLIARRPTWALVVALLVAGPASAQLADLAVDMTWEQLPNTKKVLFTVTVTNESTTIAFDMMNAQGFVDVMLFPDKATQPDAKVDGSPDNQVLLPEFIAPGGTWQHPITIDYEVAGDYQAWVMVDTLAFDPELADFAYPETTKANNILGPVAITVEGDADELADLVVSGMTAEVNNTQVKYVITVQNIGGVHAPDGFKVDVLFDSAACPPDPWKSLPTDELFGDVYADVPGGLAPNETKQITIAQAFPGPGTHNSCAIVNLDGVVLEPDVTNNVFGPVQFVIDDVPDPPAPDLDITLFNVQALGAVVTYKVAVDNVGTSPSQPFTVDLWYHSLTVPAKEQPSSYFFSVPALGVGDHWSGEHVQSPAPNGTYKSWVWADKEDVVGDKALPNNIEGPFPYIVNVAEDKPDLSVVDVDWTEIGGELHYDVTVRNQGTSAAYDVDVDIFYSMDHNPNCAADDLSGVPADTFSIEELGPGAQITVPFAWKKPIEGEHDTYVKVDCFGNVPELDETNNDLGPVPVVYEEIIYEGVDLIITNFQGQVQCTKVSYLGELKNIGDEDAPEFQIHIFYQREANPNFGLDGDFVLVVEDGLKAGESLSIPHTRSGSAPSDTYTSWLVLDNYQEVSEINEGNNITYVSVVVDEPGCTCVANQSIDDACFCGSETVFEGFCCNGEWQTEPFGVCSEDQVGDNGDQVGDGPSTGDGGSTGSDAGGHGDAHGNLSPTYDVSGQRFTQLEDTGCVATPGPTGSAPTALLLLLAMSALALTRRRRA